MRVLLDANALISVLLGQPAMALVVRILRDGSAAMTGTNIAEVYDIAVRREGFSTTRVADVIDPLLEGALTPVAVDVALARRAGEIRAAHYRRASSSISLADSVLLAAAKRGDKIATSDSDVLAVAAELGIETIELPPSSG